MSASILVPLVGPLVDLARRAIGDPDERAAVETALRRAAAEVDATLAEAGRDVVVAEATGQSAVQRNWRPHFMYVCMILLVWHAVPVPILAVLLDVPVSALVALDHVPSGLWTLLTVGMGGYIGARTIEKVALGR